MSGITDRGNLLEVVTRGGDTYRDRIP